MRRFLRRHGLSLVLLGILFPGSWVGQTLTGLGEYNEERQKHGSPALELGAYLKSPHFLEATAENWESEFLQMFVYVVATAYLFQKGSAESKDPDAPPSAQADRLKPNAPWPVRHGGWVERIYEHSLSVALAGLFFVSFALHLGGGLRLYNEERLAEGERALSTGEFIHSTRFWFQSFQNWQSEFLAIGSMVVLSIFLREKNSPESKRVETPHWENEE